MITRYGAEGLLGFLFWGNTKRGGSPQLKMFQLSKPTDEQVRAFAKSAASLKYSYHELACTRGPAPPGYTVDHNRVRLGQGEAVFNRAVAALRHWKHFDLGWVNLVPSDAPIAPEMVVIVIVNHILLWSMNSCRIVYVNDDGDSEVKRFGFAYGTLTEHAEQGEERFMIDWDTTDDSVWYDILAYSRPRHWLARFSYPLTRWWQKRFARDSINAMVRHTNLA